MNRLNFSWIIDGKLAGHAAPKSPADIVWLKKQGIKALIRMAETESALVTGSDIVESGISDYHSPVKDFTPPTPIQLNSMVDIINKYLAEGKAVGISCGAGLGRTGTILASYLISTGLTPEAAIAEVRSKRPGSIETLTQEAAIEAYANLHG